MKLTQEEIDLAIKNLNSSNSDCLTLEEIDKLLIELSKKTLKSMKKSMMVFLMKSKDEYFVYNSEYYCWMHRTPLKCFVNPILRTIQFWTDKPYVIYSKCEKIEGKWHFKKYGFGRVKYIKT